MSLNCISSMAPKSVLIELINLYNKQNNATVNIEFKGGVEVKTIILKSNHNYDLVFLALDALNELIQNDLITADKADLVYSNVGMAINNNYPNPEIKTKMDLFNFLLSIIKIGKIGYSTGPSGTQLIKLLKENNLYEDLKNYLIQAPTGIPVAQLIADKKIILGFQQLSELINYQNNNIRIIGKLPNEIAIKTIFSVGILKQSVNNLEAKNLLNFLTADKLKDIKLKAGFEIK